MTVFWTFLILFWISCFYMFWRNNFVYNYRMRVLHDKNFSVGDCLARFHRLPSYDKMMWQVWKFNYSEFLEEKK